MQHEDCIVLLLYWLAIIVCCVCLPHAGPVSPSLGRNMPQTLYMRGGFETDN